MTCMIPAPTSRLCMVTKPKKANQSRWSRSIFADIILKTTACRRRRLHVQSGVKAFVLNLQ